LVAWGRAYAVIGRLLLLPGVRRVAGVGYRFVARHRAHLPGPRQRHNRLVSLDVRRLAAIDMYGTVGGARRRRIIRAELDVGAIACLGLGIVALVSSGGLGVVLGVWLVCIGANYVPLAVTAHSLSRPGALEAEMAGLDVSVEIRTAGVRQLWILVPFAVVVASVRQQSWRARRPRPARAVDD
jgi:hypothetical protein